MEEPEFLHLFIQSLMKEAFPMLGFVRKAQRTKEELLLCQRTRVRMQPHLGCRARFFSLRLKRMHVQKIYRKGNMDYESQSLCIEQLQSEEWQKKLGIFSLENKIMRYRVDSSQLKSRMARRRTATVHRILPSIWEESGPLDETTEKQVQTQRYNSSHIGELSCALAS